MQNPDILVIGGGAGGLVVTSGAAQLGRKVLLVEKEEKLGGDCLHYGCVPSKTLIKAGKVAHYMKHAAEFGLPAVNVDVDMARVSQHIQRVIKTIQVHDEPERFEAYGAEVVFGSATFINQHEVAINGQIIRPKRVVIATGSSPLVPPIPGLKEAGYLTNIDVFSLQDLPKKLVVIGGGPIGIELAQAFARLGSEVTVVATTDHILPRDDAELADILHLGLQQESIQIITKTRVDSVSLNTHENNANEKTMHLSNGNAITCDTIIVAIGRRPNTDELGLEAAGIKHNPRGIIVDAKMRTSLKHVYACGDVCGPFPFTHMAEYQAGIIISNAVFRFPKKANYKVVPWVTYSDPELAQAGLSEQDAIDQNIQHEVLRFDFKDIDRAIAEVETRGRAKLIINKKGRILGASILGSHAGELIHEMALAIQKKMKVGDISALIHAYPTFIQVNRRTANSWYTAKLFNNKTRFIIRWINRILA
ncbi:MAG: NAD(P)/FAD-dependent oxidoreductase [Gammaproteobacteria bacterium]|nr:NAD(P)/FAD-dependent oxidoreductase [Gammaproteobacteria bacterium]